MALLLAAVMLMSMLLSACDLWGTIFPTHTSTEPGSSSTTPSSSSTTAKPDPCDKCVDEDKDGLCDVCGEEFKEDQVPVELKETVMYVVGDSTAAAFSDSYYYPRYGYATQLKSYLSEKVTLRNFALSGRSSKSFLTEANYTTLKNDLKEGDILVIAFGHNDEKSDEESRFTDASKPYNDPSSFGYYLYEYYIKLAQEIGAIPVLCTPIVRADSKDDYTGAKGHNTDTGDYAKAIREVGEAYGVDVIDLTVLTRNQYEDIGYEAACYYHAVLQGKYDTDGTTIIPDWKTVDTTHLNIYGAKYVAYLFASELSELDGIGGYVLGGISEPTIDGLVPLDGYKVPDYTAPDLEEYEPADHFATISDGWYGTAFGNTGGSPQSASNGFIAKEVSEGVFHVGQYLESGSNKGKFQSADDGFAFAFRQISKDKNFTLTVSGRIVHTAGVKQAGFGLMLRDDCIIGQSAAGSIASNFVTAGFYYPDDNVMNANFYRENGSLNKGSSVSGTVAVDDTFTMTIERIGQVVNVTLTYGGNTYTKTHTDFDFVALDTEYMYVGMFSTRGTVVEFTNVQFEITGDSMGA